MDIDNGRRRIKPHERAHGPGNGVGNIVQLEIQKHRQPRGRNLPISRLARGIEQLHADLDHVDLILQGGGQSRRLFGIRHVQRHAQRRFRRV